MVLLSLLCNINNGLKINNDYYCNILQITCFPLLRVYMSNFFLNYFGSHYLRIVCHCICPTNVVVDKINESVFIL